MMMQLPLALFNSYYSQQYQPDLELPKWAQTLTECQRVLQSRSKSQKQPVWYFLYLCYLPWSELFCSSAITSQPVQQAWHTLTEILLPTYLQIYLFLSRKYFQCCCYDRQCFSYFCCRPVLGRYILSFLNRACNWVFIFVNIRCILIGLVLWGLSVTWWEESPWLSMLGRKSKPHFLAGGLMQFWCWWIE